jgi:MFS family permease
LYVGSLIGFFVIPYVADNWGRKIGIRIAWILYAIGVAIVCLSDSPNMVGLGLFLAGFGVNPAITLCYSFLNEQCLRGSRQYYGIAIQVFLALG